MSGWELATWLSIVTLILGSLGIFGWFLADLAGRWRATRRAVPAADLEAYAESGPAAEQASGPVVKAVDGLALAMFVFSIIVQFNDPDPLRWAAMYAAAAAACALWLARRLRWWFAAAVAAVAAAWAASIAPRVVGRVPFLDMFGAFEMRSVGIEESREMYGLLLIALWMALLAVRAYRRP